jgi:hypothetical protein
VSTNGPSGVLCTLYGFGDPKAKLPRDLDAVFISTHTPRAPLAYALSKQYRREGVRTIIGGPHAKAYPHNCLRYFDLVVLECDPDLIADIIDGRFEPHSVVSSQKPYDDTPTLEERLPEIRPLPQMVELYTLATSDQLLKPRLRGSTQLFANYTHHVRTFLTKPMLGAFRKVLARLQTDTQYLSFHRGESDVLPDVYVREYQRQLGKYAELMPITESHPFLYAEAIIPANLGVPATACTAA